MAALAHQDGAVLRGLPLGEYLLRLNEAFVSDEKNGSSASYDGSSHSSTSHDGSRHFASDRVARAIINGEPDGNRHPYVGWASTKEWPRGSPMRRSPKRFPFRSLR